MAHGACKDCQKDVDCIVVRDQVVGPEEIICPECKIKRIQIKTRETIDEIRDKAAEVRSARNEQLQLFAGTEKSTGEKLAKVALLDWQRTADEDGDFWTAPSSVLQVVSDLTLVPAQYRIQTQFETNADTGSRVKMFVICGDPGTVPEDADDVAYLAHQVAMKKCEAIEAEALAANVRAKIGAESDEEAQVEA